jgi:hypothetical protein
MRGGAGQPLGALGLHGERGGGAGAVDVTAVDVGGHGQHAGTPSGVLVIRRQSEREARLGAPAG